MKHNKPNHQENMERQCNVLKSIFTDWSEIPGSVYILYDHVEISRIKEIMSD